VTGFLPLHLLLPLPLPSLPLILIFFINSYYTSICLQHKPNEIATAAIYLAAKFLQLEIPDGEEKEWWMVFGANFSNVEGSKILNILESK
jgi:hypothetical protein